MTTEQVIVWNLINRYIARYDFSVVELTADANWCYVKLKGLNLPPQDVRTILLLPDVIHEIAFQNRLTPDVMKKVDEVITG
jgi:hypothetical protein